MNLRLLGRSASRIAFEFRAKGARAALQCAATLLLLSSFATWPAAGAVATPTPIAAGQSFRITSQILADRREINIWAPAAETELAAGYTIVYLLDGGVAQDYLHIMGLAQLGSLSGTFGPLVLVGVETRNRRAELTPAPVDERFQKEFPDSGDQARFRRYLREEVQPFVEKKFPRHGRRALMGESLAGLFVLDTFLRTPEAFDDYIAISPSLWWDRQRLAREFAAHPGWSTHVRRRLYLAIADEGGAMKTAFDRIAALVTASLAADAVKVADRSGDASHATIFHSSAEAAMRWLYASPPYDYGPAPWYLEEESAPREK